MAHIYIYIHTLLSAEAGIQVHTYTHTLLYIVQRPTYLKSNHSPVLFFRLPAGLGQVRIRRQVKPIGVRIIGGDINARKRGGVLSHGVEVQPNRALPEKNACRDLHQPNTESWPIR